MIWPMAVTERTLSVSKSGGGSTSGLAEAHIYVCGRGMPWGLLERLFTAPWASMTRLDPPGVRRWDVCPGVRSHVL
jgi:hypothetical protein